MYFCLVVCLPLAVIVGLGWRLARHEHDLARQRLRDVLLLRLQDIDRVLGDYFDRRERELLSLTESLTADPEDIRAFIRTVPFVGQVFIRDASGGLIHPDPRTPLNQRERQFLADFGDFVLHGSLPSVGSSEGQAASPSGWVGHFQGPGLNLFYCRQLPSGLLVGVLLPRARWISDLIGELPDAAQASSRTAESSWIGHVRLVDSNGDTVYEWGLGAGNADAKPLQELRPSPPLSSWRLQHFADEQAIAALGRSANFNLWSLLAACGLAVVAAFTIFYREYNRQIRESLHRVSFVNQVSHELKTPLTNIRMYAELLESDLDAACGDRGEEPRGHVKVIVEESQRLSRLIGNVLTFARDQRRQITLRRQPAVVDEVIGGVVKHFDPALKRCGMEVAIQMDAPAVVQLDVDALEQMLGNLLNNVEKYAASGRRLDISTHQSGDRTRIVVADDGPGVPSRFRERIFKPFFRLSNHIADSPGTGIGLTIARQLARLHGGDLVLLPSHCGARFEIRLHAPQIESESRT